MSKAPVLSAATAASSVIGTLPPPSENLSIAAAVPMALKYSLTQNRSKYHAAIANAGRTSSRTTVRCDVAMKSTASVDLDPSSSSSSDAELGAEEKGKKVGARIRVKVPLKVYHVVRVPELELTGMEGVMKDYVAVWKGKRISANLPYKVEFVKEIEGRGPVKFFAHLKEDEFEFIE